MNIKTSLSFTVSMRDGVIYNQKGISEVLIDCLRKRCSELSIKSVKKSKYMPQGLGATGGGFGLIHDIAASIYHNLGPIYSFLRDSPLIVESIKWFICLILSIKNKLISLLNRRRYARGGYYLKPVLVVNIRIDVDTRSYIDLCGKCTIVKRSMIETINLIDEFSIAINNINPELDVIYNITAKSIESNAGVSVVNVINSDKLKKQIIDIINKTKSHHHNFSIYVKNTYFLKEPKPVFDGGRHVW